MKVSIALDPKKPSRGVFRYNKDFYKWLQKYSASDFDSLVNGWEEKIAVTEDGDLTWGLITGSKLK